MQPRVLVEVLDHLWKNRCTYISRFDFRSTDPCLLSDFHLLFVRNKQTHQGFIEDGDRHGAEVGWTLPWVKQAVEKVDFYKGVPYDSDTPIHWRSLIQEV